MAAHQALVLGILQARILEWVAISFSSAWKWEVKVKSFSCVQCFATPWPVAYQAPPSMGVPRQEYWSGVPLPSPQARRREVLFKMSLGEGGWATIVTWEWVQWSWELPAWPCGPLRSKGLRRKGQSCGLSGHSKLSVECRLGSLDPSHALSFPTCRVSHPPPPQGPGLRWVPWRHPSLKMSEAWKQHLPLDCTLILNILCAFASPQTWTAVLSSGWAQQETCIEQSYSSSGRSGWEIHTCFQASGYQWPYNPVQGGGLQGLSFPAELEKNEKLFRKRWVGTEVEKGIPGGRAPVGRVWSSGNLW